MSTPRPPLSMLLIATIVFSIAMLASCKSIGPSTDETTHEVASENCAMPQGHNLDSAFTHVQTALTQQRRQCAPLFELYWQRLLEVAEGDPDTDNKRKFSDFLVAISSQGIISERQAQNRYNRYFNIKFVSLIGDYSICSQACPARSAVMADMSLELSHKEQGLLKIGTDRSSYQRADQLMKETELVLEATCASCSALR